MSYNKKAYSLGSKRSIIREIFEYSKKRSLEIGADNVFDFSLGNPSVCPPEEVENSIVDLVEKSEPIFLHGYTSAQGDFITREKIANNLNDRYNAGLCADNIYMTCGAAASLCITLNALVEDGDQCVVFAPFFTEYRVFIEKAGAEVVVSDPVEKTFQIDFDDLEKKIGPNTKAVIVNSPNNPSGVVYTEQTIIRLCDMLKRKSKEYGKTIYLISDEPYRELIYSDVKFSFVMNYYEDSIVCYSFSKSLSLPGERIGYIAVNPKLNQSKEVYLAVCGAGRSLGYVCAPSLFQRVVAENLTTKINVEAYRENRDLLYDGLSQIGYECVKPDGAFYLFVKALEDDAYKFFEKAREYEILIVPCDDFGVKGYVRIAYCVDKARIEKSLPAFKRLYDEYKGYGTIRRIRK